MLRESLKGALYAFADFHMDIYTNMGKVSNNEVSICKSSSGELKIRVLDVV